MEVRSLEELKIESRNLQREISAYVHRVQSLQPNITYEELPNLIKDKLRRLSVIQLELEKYYEKEVSYDITR